MLKNRAVTAYLFCLILAITVLVHSSEPMAQETEADAKEAAEDKTVTIRIEDWLLLGPISSPLPAFSDEGKKKIDAASLLAYEDIPIDKLKPLAGIDMNLIGGAIGRWVKVSADTAGVDLPAGTDAPLVAYLAAYVEIDRWMEIDVKAKSTHPFELSIDGSSVVKAKKPAKGGDRNTKSGSVKLARGKHLVIAKTVFVPADTITPWFLDITFEVERTYESEPTLSLVPDHSLSHEDILNTPSMSGIDLSPDGSLIALFMRQYKNQEGDAERWLEIRDSKRGELVRTIKDLTSFSSVQWAPTGRRISYVTRTKKKGTVRIIDLDTGTAESVIEEVEELGGYRWAPDGSYIVYSVTEKPEKDKTGVKRLRGLQDRRRNGRDRSFLYISTVPGGHTRRLTAGNYGSYVHDIHPDGKKLLVGRSIEDLSERPYGKSELILLDLAEQRAEILWKGPWLRRASWSADGKKMLILAGPSSFGEKGKNVPEGVIPNDYDTQAYIFDPVTREVEPLTRDFSPAIQSARWAKWDGNIYFVVEEKSYQYLYRYEPKKKRFRRIDLGFDYLGSGDFALEKPLAAFVGLGAINPPRLYTIDLAKDRVRLIHDPSADIFLNVTLEDVEDWNFTAPSGTTIEGRIHFPPHFDPSVSYPCIVYYYGGTSPTGRTFGGRYPKNLWASNGYIVYVLQPSGATGFGQEFSSRHVNDWGKVVSEEIIEGVGKFVEAHPYVDPERIGCIGASYGGFMTQLLITRTDIFAAAVSHAGISSITSYWGKGYWGFGYNAVAAAESFPWNRRDIYVDQSPLFAADKVTTPLLLLHGANDTNVPPGESDQMYIALKLLDREVEYIKFAEQSHFILDYKKRVIWSNAILAWFDRWLKGEPEWWNDMYPPLEEAVPEKLGAHTYELEKYGTVLMGEVTREDITESIHDWDAEYFYYTPDAELLGELEQYIYGVHITIVLGTWCSDSRTQVPRLWKILEDLHYPISEVTMFTVGSSRFTAAKGIPSNVLKWSDALKKKHDVERVATFIITRDGEEIGRIIESPEESLEKDLLKILAR